MVTQSHEGPLALFGGSKPVAIGVSAGLLALVLGGPFLATGLSKWTSDFDPNTDVVKRESHRTRPIVNGSEKTVPIRSSESSQRGEAGQDNVNQDESRESQASEQHAWTLGDDASPEVVSVVTTAIEAGPLSLLPDGNAEQSFDGTLNKAVLTQSVSTLVERLIDPEVGGWLDLQHKPDARWNERMVDIATAKYLSTCSSLEDAKTCAPFFGKWSADAYGNLGKETNDKTPIVIGKLRSIQINEGEIQGLLPTFNVTAEVDYQSTQTDDVLPRTLTLTLVPNSEDGRHFPLLIESAGLHRRG